MAEFGFFSGYKVLEGIVSVQVGVKALFGRNLCRRVFLQVGMHVFGGSSISMMGAFFNGKQKFNGVSRKFEELALKLFLIFLAKLYSEKV